MHDVVAVLLLRSADVRRAFWGWSEQEWLDFLGRNHRAYREQVPAWAEGYVRPFLCGHAYHLGYDGFKHLGHFDRLSLACRVFGRRRVEEEITRVHTLLTGWGYQYGNAAKEVLFRLRLMHPEITIVWADSGYAGKLVTWANKHLDLTLKTVSRPPNTPGFVILPRRWVVERPLAWIMHTRRHARYERLIQHPESLITWAAITLMTRRITRRSSRRSGQPASREANRDRSLSSSRSATPPGPARDPGREPAFPSTPLIPQTVQPRAAASTGPSPPACTALRIAHSRSRLRGACAPGLRPLTGPCRLRTCPRHCSNPTVSPSNARKSVFVGVDIGVGAWLWFLS